MEAASPMAYYLPVIWGALIATAIALYVLLDGFDLGVGILFPFLKDEDERDQMMNSVAPFWDGNETWLILGGGGLWVAFPQAYAVVMPGLYLPVILMLLALVFRGVAFEFRVVAKPDHHIWDIAFAGGSLVAAFFQGVILGGLLDGIHVVNGVFAGGSFDWLRPFPLLTGCGLVTGYALLGCGWLMMRTEGAVEERARRMALPALVLVLAFIVAASIWTGLTIPRIAERWFASDAFWFIWPVPILTAGLALLAARGIAAKRGAMTFLSSVGIFLLAFLGLAISNFPYLVPPHLTVWETAAVPESQIFVLLGVIPFLPLILMYTAFVYWTFRGRVRPGEGYH